MVIIWKKSSNCFRVYEIQLSKNKYWNMLLRETTFLAFFVHFRKARFNVQNFTMRQISKKKFTTCQISNQTLENVSEVEKNLHSKGRFMNHVTPRKRHLFAFSLLFQNAWIKKTFFCASKFCVGIWKKVCFRKITFWITLVNKNDLFDLFCITLKSLFLNKQLQDASDFQIKI